MFKRVLDLGFLVLCVCLLYFFGYYNLLGNFSRIPSGNYYIGFAANYPIDQLGNLSVIQQGYAGEWLRDTHYTTTVESAKFALKVEYILIGHIGRLLGLNPIHAYYVATLTLSILLIVTIWYVIQKSLPKNYQMLGFFFALFATGFSWGDLPLGWRQLQGDMMVFQRLTTASPHYMIGSIGSLLSMVFLASYFETKMVWRLFLSVCLGMIAMHVFAPAMIIVLLALPLSMIFAWMQHKSKRLTLGQVKVGIVYILPMLVPMAYNRYATQFFDWSTFARTEKLLPYVVNWFQYIFLIGGLLIPALIAVPKIIRKGSFLLILLLSWAIAQIVAQFFIRTVIGASVVRFFQTPYYVIFAVLGTIGVQVILETSKQYLGKRVAKGVSLLIAALIILIGWHTYIFSFNWQRSCFCETYPKDIGYPTTGIAEALFWIDRNVSHKAAIMTGEYTGLLVPAFSGNKVYTSWWHRLTDHASYYQLLPTLLRFYKGEMSDSEAKTFLYAEKLSYVVYSVAEGYDGRRGLPYEKSVLVEEYKNNQAIIYRVK